MDGPTFGEPALLVLAAVAAEPRHGYALIEDVLTASGGRVKLRTGSLYAVLDRLRQAGYVEVDREEVVSSRLRRYYRITAAGAARLADETERLRSMVRAADHGLRRLGLAAGGS